MAERPYQTVEEVAEHFGFSTRRLHLLIRKHGIPVLRRGRWVRLDSIAIEAVKNAMRGAPLPTSEGYLEVLQRLDDSLEAARVERKSNTKGCVYFIQSAGPDAAIKIGFSTNPQERRAELQVAHPHPLVLLATKHGTMADEDRLHFRFAQYRMNGEWHRPGKRLLTYIQGLASYRKRRLADG